MAIDRGTDAATSAARVVHVDEDHLGVGITEVTSAGAADPAGYAGDQVATTRDAYRRAYFSDPDDFDVYAVAPGGA